MKKEALAAPALWTKKWAEDSGKPFDFFDTIKSSNAAAKNLKRTAEAPLLIMAQKQTHPYGRKNRMWTPSSFMATWTWGSSETLSPVFSPLMGLVLYKTFQNIWPSDLWALKAPNDIYLTGKKTSGLLLETQMIGEYTQIILGLGINVFKAPAGAECIQNHHFVNEPVWKNFLDCFWKFFLELKNKNACKISLEESRALKQALKMHPQYRELNQVLEDGSLVFKNQTLHWLDL